MKAQDGHATRLAGLEEQVSELQAAVDEVRRFCHSLLASGLQVPGYTVNGFSHILTGCLGISRAAVVEQCCRWELFCVCSKLSLYTLL